MRKVLTKDGFRMDEKLMLPALAEDILNLLKKEPSKYISGEEMAQRFGVTRSAVWKQIRYLRELGYMIDAEKTGYCLQALPDRLYPQEIQNGLSTRYIGQSEIHYYKEVDSTNEIARNLAEKGSLSGTIVIAEAQRKGRGRLSRPWWSPPYKGIWLSVLWRPQLSPKEAFLLSFATAVATARAIKEIYPTLEVNTKWPNDILLKGKKAAGILLEVKAELDQVHYVVAGIGLNVNQQKGNFPPEIRSLATSLAIELNQEESRLKITQKILSCLEEEYLFLEKGKKERLWQKWQEFDLTVGKEVEVVSGPKTFKGTVTGITEEGRLVVKTVEGEIKEFSAGDVTLSKNK